MKIGPTFAYESTGMGTSSLQLWTSLGNVPDVMSYLLRWEIFMLLLKCQTSVLIHFFFCKSRDGVSINLLMEKI